MPSSKSATKRQLNQPHWQWSFEAIGTQWWIGIYEDPSINADQLQSKIARLIDDFDRTYSRFRADSLVSKMAQKGGTYALPASAESLLNLYQELYDATDGGVTPLVGQLLSDMGYDANYSLKPQPKLPSVKSWAETMEVRQNTITLHRPALLDFGAAGKGCLVDLVSALLQAEGVTQFCVDAGGDMYCQGLERSLRVGLENPDNPQEAIGLASINGQALCGSAPNRRAWGEHHHIVNPQAKAPTANLKAVWVTADATMLADGLATALFFAEPEALKALFNFEYALVYADGSLRYSPQFPAEFFD